MTKLMMILLDRLRTILIFTIYLSIWIVLKGAYGQLAGVNAGKVIRIDNFRSKFVAPRNIDVWLPDDYNPGQKYAVLYMHDGQMLFDSTITWNGQEWMVDEAVARLVGQKKIRPCIIVGIWNGGASRHAEYFPEKPFRSLPRTYQDSLVSDAKRNESTALFSTDIQSDNYLRFIVNELKPFIDSTFSTLPDRRNTCIAGSSMGGLISLYAICEYPEIFGGAACLSTHWPGIFTVENNPIPDAFMSYLKDNLPPPGDHKIYFDYGTETLDALYEPYQKQVDKIMNQKGYTAKNWKTLKFKGEDHSENAWSRRIEIPVEFLLE